MKKLLSLFFAAAMLLTLASCGEAAPKELDIAAIKESIVADVKIDGLMDMETQQLTELYGIAEEDVAECASFFTMTGIFPDEAIMVKAKDTEAQKRIVSTLEEHLEDIKLQSQNYDAENYALAQECKVITYGDYVAMFVSAHHTEMETAFNNATK